MIFFAVGIARSWGLLGLRGGGVLDLLVGRQAGLVPASPPPAAEENREAQAEEGAGPPPS